MRKFLALLLTVVMLLGMMPMSAFAAEEALPEAKINDLGKITVEDYQIYNGSLTEGTGSKQLQEGQFVDVMIEDTMDGDLVGSALGIWAAPAEWEE